MIVLVVCTGNTCRSPMAEGLLKSFMKEAFGESGWQVGSAGTAALDGDEAAENAIAAMEEMGIDIRSHRARLVNLSMIEDADLILAMTERHRDAVIALVPDAADKIRVLAMADPYGMPLEVYRECALELSRQLRELTDEIKKEEEEKGRKKNNREE